MVNMRQQGDPRYANTLGRLRIGSPTAEDVAALQSRTMANLFRNDPAFSNIVEPSPTLLSLADGSNRKVDPRITAMAKRYVEFIKEEPTLQVRCNNWCISSSFLIFLNVNISRSNVCHL
jgi:hypothetical protein